jgi:hypothetical protein
MEAAAARQAMLGPLNPLLAAWRCHGRNHTVLLLLLLVLAKLGALLVLPTAVGVFVLIRASPLYHTPQAAALQKGCVIHTAFLLCVLWEHGQCCCS